MAPTLREEVSRWFGRAVIVARGADDARAAAETALARGNPVAAWFHARDLLERVPRSPVGYALAADAAESAGLDAQACEPLQALSGMFPWRGDVWLRLALARQRAGDDGGGEAAVREALGRAVQSAEEPDTLARAVTTLADLDLAAGDPARALAWIERASGLVEIASASGQRLLERRAMALLDLGSIEDARRATSSLTPQSAADGPRALLDGRIAAAVGQPALTSLLRAYLLDTPGAERALAAQLSRCTGDERTLVRDIIVSKGDGERPLFRAAMASASGDAHLARVALLEATQSGDLDAARALSMQAIDARDGVLLREAHVALKNAGFDPPPVEMALAAGDAALGRGELAGALDLLEAAGSHPWGAELRAAVMTRWFASETTDVKATLGELRRAARVVDDVPTLLETETLAVEAVRPLRMAILGEFNAGKSTFVNALMGVDLAPTGILPTTATLHHVVYSPDPFARISIAGAPERVVPHERLRAALGEVHAAGQHVERVVIGVPQDRLRSVEIIDTPGFNAPDPKHREAALRAFDQLHAAVWLLDAAQPLKDTERTLLVDLLTREIPVQIIVNKADRLSPEDLVRVTENIRSNLESIGVRSLAGVLTVSARLALAGRLGDASALEASGWGEIEAALARELIERADFWKDRVIRRRIRAMASTLRARADVLATRETAAAREDLSRLRAWADASTRTRQRSTSTLRMVERALETPRRLLEEDLSPLNAAADAAATRPYARARAVYRLTGPLAEAFVDAVDELTPFRRDAIHALYPAISAALVGMVAALEDPLTLPSLPVSRLLEGLVEPVASAFAAGPISPARPPPVGAPLSARLAALEIGARSVT
jgi:GTP-binding protein EngB required for normal cell division